MSEVLGFTYGDGLVAGYIVECVGGPFDGRELYINDPYEVVPVHFFYDGNRTPTTLLSMRRDDNKLGQYRPRVPYDQRPRVAEWEECT